MKYQLKPLIVDAIQWFKNGDHPLDYANEKVGLENGEIRKWTGAECKANEWEGQVVRYYRNPFHNGKTICGRCGRTMHEHGWIDSGKDSETVCPGDWVITGPGPHGHHRVDNETFHKLYEHVEELADSSIHG